MAQLYFNIQAGSWQLALGKPGEIVTDLEDIAQCIRIIVTTTKGSVPHRPDFGTEVYTYLDRPLTEAGPNLVRETIEAISLWEPRAVIDHVTPIYTEAGVELNIEWHPRDNFLQIQKTVIKL